MSHDDGKVESSQRRQHSVSLLQWVEHWLSYGYCERPKTTFTKLEPLFGIKIEVARRRSTQGFFRLRESHSSWQCKESHSCCYHGHLAPLSMGDSKISTVITRCESMRLRSLRQSGRITARDQVQHKGWTYLCWTEQKLIWTRWWCTKSSKHLAKGDK